MAKVWAQLSATTRLALVLILAVGAYLYFGDSGSTAKKAPAKKIVKKTSGSTAIQYTDADYKASFAVLQQPLKDSFKPLVVRSGAREAGSAARANGVPASLAGGDVNWTYTGTAEVDDVPTVLIENSSTGEGVFLRQGERWKDMVIEQIAMDFVTLRGDDGEIVTLRLTSPNEDEEVKPLSPDNPLSGPIGGTATVPTNNPSAPQFGNVAVEAAPAQAAPPPTRAVSGRKGRRGTK